MPKSNMLQIENLVANARSRRGLAKALGKHDVYFNVQLLSTMTNGYIIENGTFSINQGVSKKMGFTKFTAKNRILNGLS
jgi:hypothetical protein